MLRASDAQNRHSREQPPSSKLVRAQAALEDQGLAVPTGLIDPMTGVSHMKWPTKHLGS